MRWATGLLLTGLLAGGCSLPRLIVLNDPLDARQHNDLGVVYEQRGELDLALREYRRASELDQSWSVPLVNRGNALAGLGDWHGAAASYRAALNIDPQRREALNNLAWALLQSGQPAEALPWAERAVAAAAVDPHGWDTLAGVYLALDRPEDARQAAVRGLALDPPAGLRSALESKLARP